MMKQTPWSLKLKPFSSSECLHTQLPVAAQWFARQKNPSIYITPHICKLGPTLSSTLLWWLNTWGHSGLCHPSKTFVALPWTLSNILIFFLATAALPSRANVRDPVLLFLPSSVFMLSYSLALGPSIQLTFAHWRSFPRSFFSILLPGVHCPINAAFILCSCIHVHHHICCLLEPGSPSALYSSLSVTSSLHYLPLPGSLHHQQTTSVVILHFLPCHW